MRLLKQLLAELPDEARRRALTHASWAPRRSDAYDRLAFLGDSVLGLAITTYLFPALDPERYGPGRLTKIRAQAVSGRACRDVADELGVADLMREIAPADGSGQNPESLVTVERVLASVMEALLGACYLEFGYERTAEAIVEAFAGEIELALTKPADFKSALQERLAREGQAVSYAVLSEKGPAHQRIFEVGVTGRGKQIAVGKGRSKKEAEQDAAEAALREIEQGS